MSIAAQLQTLCDARTALVAKCNLMGAPVPQNATLRMCERALCQLAGINSRLPGGTQLGELSFLRGDLVRAATNLGFEVPSNATIPEVVEILQPSQIETSAYAVAIAAEEEGLYDLHFYRAVNAPTIGTLYNGKRIQYVFSDFEETEYEYPNDLPWWTIGYHVRLVRFDAEVKPISCEGWFQYFSKCKTFDLGLLNTERCTSFNLMFDCCESVMHLDLSNFDTRNCTVFSNMFYGCSSLVEIKADGWNLKKAKGMVFMFAHCPQLQSLNLSTWKFGTSLTSARGCFYNCGNLKIIYTAPDCDLSYVAEGSLMFDKSMDIIGGNGTYFNNSHITAEYARVDKPGQPGYFTAYRDMTGEAFAVFTSGGELVFARGQKPQPGERYKGAMVVASYDFDETAVFVNPGEVPWHDYDHGILSVRFDGWIKPQSCSLLFTYLMDCESFDLAGLWCGENPDFTHMFYACYALRELDLSPLCDVTPASIDAMFAYCDLLQTIYVKPGTDWSSAYDNNYAFRFCYSLVGGAGTVYDWDNVGSDRAIIDGAGGKPGYFTAK